MSTQPAIPKTSPRGCYFSFRKSKFPCTPEYAAQTQTRSKSLTRYSHFCHTYAFFSRDPQTGQVLAEEGDLVDGAGHQSQDAVAGTRILADETYGFRHERDMAGPPFEVYRYSHVPLLAQVNQMGDICNDKHPRSAG